MRRPIRDVDAGCARGIDAMSVPVATRACDDGIARALGASGLYAAKRPHMLIYAVV
jgi:hypothetical protein